MSRLTLARGPSPGPRVAIAASMRLSSQSSCGAEASCSRRCLQGGSTARPLLAAPFPAPLKRLKAKCNPRQHRDALGISCSAAPTQQVHAGMGWGLSDCGGGATPSAAHAGGCGTGFRARLTTIYVSTTYSLMPVAGCGAATCRTAAAAGATRRQQQQWCALERRCRRNQPRDGWSSCPNSSGG